jgi:hypothetical protein
MTDTAKAAGLPMQRVFAFFRDHPDVVFVLEDICWQTGCTPSQVCLALDTLVRHGLIVREQTVGGRDAYSYRRHA